MKPSDFGGATNPRRRTGLPIITAIMVFCAPYMGASAAANHPPVSPNQDFSNHTLQLHSPTSDGWYGLSQTPGLIAFAKSGPIANESFVAQVNLFHLPTFLDSEAFTEFVREAVIKDSPADRFEALEVNVQYSPERGYPCVTYHAVSNDQKARVSFFSKKILRFELFALYCQNPTKPGIGFSAVFSHRGGSPDENIDQEAAAFISSVQVTPPSPAP